MHPVRTLVVAATLAQAAHAFTVDGFSSGMSREQVAAVAESRALEVWEMQRGSVAIGRRSDLRVDGTFAFCDGALFVFSHSVDFDADYFQLMRDFLAKYGQPREISTAEHPWTGQGRGKIRSIDTVWVTSSDRVSISLTPEGRDGKGQLRYNRSVNVSYVSKTSCSMGHFRNE